MTGSRRMLHLVSEHAYELHGDDPGAVERLAQAAGHGEVIYLTRAGQPIAAVVPAALAAAIEAAEDAEDITAADEAMDAVEAGEPAIPAEELWAELGLDSTSPR
jgi:antitoxin (DNA-binding transcriptional repressor) of toxin-antitoxin stability system